MNEYSILFHLLSRQKSDSSSPTTLIVGASGDEIKENLGMGGKYSHHRFLSLLEQFSQNIQPFGLILRQNPFNHLWYLTQKQDVQNFFHTNPFQNKPRLAATFATILSLCLINSGSTDLSTIQKMRKKKDIQTDIDELVHLLLINQSGNQIKLHENVGYYMDVELFSQYMEKEAYQSMNSPEDNVSS